MSKVLLVLPTSTYRATDFLDAARRLGVDVVVASEEQQALAPTMGDRFLKIDLCEPEIAAGEIARHSAKPDAIVGVDEQGVLVAAHAAELLGLPHNPPAAVAATRDKRKLREVLTGAGLPQPRVMTRDDATYPCVVKATTLSGSRGVIRANDRRELDAAIERVEAIAGDGADVLIEGFMPGAEVALEGLLDGGTLYVLALFDKPDPLEGPYFEETIYVTPSLLEPSVRTAIERVVADACAAIGLVDGPVHAEVRVPSAGGVARSSGAHAGESVAARRPSQAPPDGPPVVLEVAARSIGGLCSRALRFGAGISLEEVILRHALGKPLGDLTRTRSASGVMMIPIPRSGVLTEVGGVAAARAVNGIEGIEITVPRGQEVLTLPEGDRYLGFIFATGRSPAAVESALRRAHSRLDIRIS